jgi:hypothetical protein
MSCQRALAGLGERAPGRHTRILQTRFIRVASGRNKNGLPEFTVPSTSSVPLGLLHEGTPKSSDPGLDIRPDPALISDCVVNRKSKYRNECVFVICLFIRLGTRRSVRFYLISVRYYFTAKTPVCASANAPQFVQSSIALSSGIPPEWPALVS